jgi:hypothetical protein
MGSLRRHLSDTHGFEPGVAEAVRPATLPFMPETSGSEF